MGGTPALQSEAPTTTLRIFMLLRSLGDLVHATQRERGGSSVFLASEGKRFSSELGVIRQESDVQVNSFLRDCEAYASQEYLTDSDFELLLQTLDGLTTVRADVDRHVLSARETIEYFTDLNETILVVSGSLIERIPQTTARRQMLSLFALLRAKELTGIERAILAQVFTEDRFTDGMYLWIVAVVAAQETLLRIAVAGADDEFAADLARLHTDSASHSTVNYETTALVNGVQHIGIDPGDWLNEVTSHIDLLKDLEDQTFDRIEAQPAPSEHIGRNDYLITEAISATLIAMNRLRSHVDGVRQGKIAYRDFVRGAGDSLAHAGRQLETALERTELTAMASRDELTGVLNRSAVPGLFKSALHRHGARSLIAAVMIDVDHFKLINDSLGHMTGDALLSAVAVRIRNALRPTDVLTRVGGDEFLAICSPCATTQEAYELADFIRASALEPFQVEDRTLSIGLSIGIGLAQRGAVIEDVLRHADIALHHAKEIGRGRVVVFNDELRRETERRHEIELGIRQALLDDSICAHFQPIICLANETTEAVEALARWETSEGTRSAAEFCPIARDTGLLPSVDAAVTRSAFTTRPTIRGRAPAVSINIGDLQLRQSGFADQFEGEMAAAGISPQDVWIEVTEHIALSTDQAVANLQRLRKQGCTIALDDFGSGFSALSILRTLPLDVVKLDGEFVRGIDSDLATRQTVSSILDILKAQGLRSVAEGVETERELEVVHTLGFAMAQGYHLGRPAAKFSN